MACGLWFCGLEDFRSGESTKALLLGSVLSALPEFSSFVIPVKRAGGPRELERVYSQRLEHSGQLGLSEEDRVALGRTMLLVP